MSDLDNADVLLDAELSRERARIVRLCETLTEDHDVAEDLAQETLVEALRHLAKLRDPTGVGPWLAAIARNVCRRWHRARAHALARAGSSASFPDTRGASDSDADPVAALDPADSFDLEMEVERDELARLLDRAMASLPAASRGILVEHVVHGWPLAEIGARHGLREGNVAVRLHRAKRALRQILTTTLADEAAPYRPPGPWEVDRQSAPSDDPWRETRIWCPLCGTARLIGRFSSGHRRFELRCLRCAAHPGARVCNYFNPDLFGQLNTFRGALWRQLAASHAAFEQNLVDRTC